jgi:hypothetical protein
VTRIVLILFLVTGCADPVDRQLAALQQQQARTQEASRAENESYHRMVAVHEAYFRKRLAQIDQLPLEQREAELDRLQREEDAWHHEQLEELNREARDLDHQQMINAQQDLTDAINSLSDQVEQARAGY